MTKEYCTICYMFDKEQNVLKWYWNICKNVLQY